jgi:two-component system chemotaxis response regulator CheY
MIRDARSARLRILIVDDNVSYARALAKLFGKEGFEVATACDGAEALELLRDDRTYALVLSDVEMPRMNGLDLLTSVRTEFGIPVVLMTARPLDGLLAPRDQAAGLLRKPIEFPLALSTVLGALSQPSLE